MLVQGSHDVDFDTSIPSFNGGCVFFLNVGCVSFLPWKPP